MNIIAEIIAAGAGLVAIDTRSGSRTEALYSYEQRYQFEAGSIFLTRHSSLPAAAEAEAA